MNPEASLRAGLHPSIVLSAYLEPLLRGRRVAVLGDATIGLADELSQRGARLVHVYDPDAARIAEALARAAPGKPHQVAYAVLAGDLGVRDGAFDVVIVPDLSLFADPADAIRRARRLVPASGAAVFVSPNAGTTGRRLLRTHGAPTPHGQLPGTPLGYYELFDLVSLQFAKVRMIGQAPFVGYTVAEFAPNGEPEVSVDTSLLASSEEPEHFLAVAGDHPVALDAYAVIELPWQDVADAAPSQPVHTTRVAEKLALVEAEARLATLGAELGAAVTRLAEREGHLAGAAARVAELDAELERRDGRLKDLEARAGDSHVRAERFSGQIRDLEEELVRQRDRGTKLSKHLDDEKRARTKAEVELGMVRGNPDLAAARSRIDALGADLDAARARVVELEMEQTTARLRPAPSPDTKLVRRLAELEQAVNAALHEAAEAAAAREAALDRAARADALAQRAVQLEAELAAGQRDRADLEERVLLADKRAAETTRRLAEADRRAVDAARHTDEAVQRLAGAEQRLADADRVAAARDALVVERDALLAERVVERDTLAAARGAQATERGALLAERAALVAERGALVAERDSLVAAHAQQAAELDAALARAATAGNEQAAAEVAAADIAALEAGLRERGQAISALARDLRESERVGKELLAELESLQQWSGQGGGQGGGAGGDDMRARLDALATGAARSEADLQAAGWRIAQLERELGEARRSPTAPPTVVQIELEQALSAARDEVATLRRALAGAPS